ncbi:galacturonan 1,4-alpha-galacturonidase [Ranunculus cassubicifolius]
MATSTVNVFLVLLLCTAFPCSLVTATGTGPTLFDILHFGAKGDGTTDNTKALLDAWRAACDCTGENMLVIPKGEFLVQQVVLAGPCKSPVHIQLEGTLVAPTDTSHFKEAEWITFDKVTGFTLTGGGTINGKGEAVWDKKKECKIAAHCPTRSINMKFRHLTDATLTNFTSLNPKGFHMCINNCNNVQIHDIKITAPGDSPNTDGMHISHSKDINITNSIIGTGDDCISIIQGDTNIYVTNVVCGPGHGISVGSLGKYTNEDDVIGIFVKNCTLRNTDNGVRVKTWKGAPPSAASNINFEDVIMDNVKNPIIIDQEYCASGRNCRGNQPSKVKLSNIHFTNIRGTSTSKNAVSMKCSPEVPCEGIELCDIDLKSATGGVPVLSECSNIKVGTKGIQFPKPCEVAAIQGGASAGSEGGASEEE